MSSFVVDTKDSFNDVLSCLKDGMPFEHIKENLYKINKRDYLSFTKEYQEELDLHDIINGVNKENDIVNISVSGNLLYVFKETTNGVTYQTFPYRHWVLAKKRINQGYKELIGNQPYRYIKEYTNDDFENNVRPLIYKMGAYTVHHKAENFMIRNGHTYFKGMKSKDVSLLSFDIETTGLNPNVDSLLLITNTFRKNDKYISKTFIINDYNNEYDMIFAWCDWVREMDPSIILGHNIVMFDIPFIDARAAKFGKALTLGRLGEQIEIEEKPREFRKDGSQTYTYRRINCFGREIIDTFFLAIKADIARKYESYGLKNIIKQEGLEEANRQHYDGSMIGKMWHIEEERTKIIAYAEADSRDPIKLFDLMIASFFYACPVIPKPFQLMIESATGSQLNSLMVRSYLQKNMSIAEASQIEEFQGAISFAVPGIYKNMLKIDFSALYPSIMREFKVYDSKKDPLKNFIKVVDYFHEYRQEYKKKFKETGDKYYDDLQNVAKVIANSCYGFLGAKGLNYNSPEKAAFITSKARELLCFTVEWATSKNVDYWLNLFQEKTK